MELRAWGGGGSSGRSEGRSGSPTAAVNKKYVLHLDMSLSRGPAPPPGRKGNLNHGAELLSCTDDGGFS